MSVTGDVKPCVGAYATLVPHINTHLPTRPVNQRLSPSTSPQIGRSPPASAADSLFHPYRRIMTSSPAPSAHVSKISGVPCPATPTRYTAPVHIDVGGTIYTSSLETLTKFPDSRLAKMFNGNIPIILDSLKQHYFIDRDGKIFRHILNYLRSQRLALPDDFRDWELLLEEARFYDIAPMVTDLEKARVERSNMANGARNSSTSMSADKVRIKVEEGTDDHCDCILLHISPDLGERISLSADRSQLQDIFPELTSALMDSRNSGWTMDSGFVLRFPLNGFCKLNSLQVMQRMLGHGYTIAASSGGGVEGQQFTEYLFCKKSPR